MEDIIPAGQHMILLSLCLLLLLLAVLVPLLLPLWREGQQRRVKQIALVVSVSSLALYALWGAPRIVPPAMAYYAHMQELRAKIKDSSEHLKNNPQDLESWLMLSQAFQESGDYVAAVRGFKQAVLISKGHPRIIMAYAEALILQAEGVVTPAAKKSIDIALMLDESLPLARYYQAVWLLQEKRQPEAMEMMKKLYHELPEDSSLKQRMKAQIGKE